MKAIQVECCSDCPYIWYRYRWWNSIREYTCGRSVDGLTVDNPTVISPDCPLPNVEEVEND